MKALIVFTDDDGNTWEHELKLVAGSSGGGGKVAKSAKRAAPRQIAKSNTATPAAKASPVFTLPMRPFMKRYGAGTSGSRRFAILLARLAKGSLATQVTSAEIEKQWNKMKPIMGGVYNGAYPTRAKDKGWVDSPKVGSYVLLGEWKEALPGA